MHGVRQTGTVMSSGSGRNTGGGIWLRLGMGYYPAFFFISWLFLFLSGVVGAMYGVDTILSSFSLLRSLILRIAQGYVF